jgi:hypothetical protein
LKWEKILFILIYRNKENSNKRLEGEKRKFGEKVYLGAPPDISHLKFPAVWRLEFLLHPTF